MSVGCEGSAMSGNPGTNHWKKRKTCETYIETFEGNQERESHRSVEQHGPFVMSQQSKALTIH